ncbi:MAG: hemagglutinin, partial [Pollutimonas bauzanensis]
YLGAIGEPNAEAACSYDPGYCVAGPGRNESTPSSLHFSVVRTGTGDLELLASGDVWMQSAYGVYTAGSDTVGQGGFSSQDFYQPRGRSSDLAGSILGSQGKTDGADYERLVDEKSDTNLYRAWYPDQGGNVVIAAGRDLLGSVWAAQVGDGPAPALLPSAGVGNWSWRQGTGAGSSADDVPTAWWVNFGTYAHEPFMQPEFSDAKRQPHLVGFTGIGALGGGNVMVDVGRHAGVVSDLGVNTEHSDALVVAIGGTGKVLADGQMALTGGGDLVMRIGGGINRVQADPAQAWQAPRHELQGAIINLRGSMDIQAAYIGRIAQEYNSQFKDRSDSRAADPFTPTAANATAGIVLAPGDATVRIAVAGDMVLGAVTDPGRSPQVSTTPYQVDGQPYEGGGLTGFSLWTDNTAVSMHSVGGDAVLSTQLGELEYQQNNPVLYRDTSPTDGSFALPSRFAMSATAGNLYMGHSGIARATKFNDSYPLMLAPSATGTGYLDLIAGKSIYAGGYTIDRSGADPSVLATPFQPRFSAWDRFEIPLATKNYPSVYAIGMDLARTNSLYAFGDIGNALWDAPPLTAAHFYAREGDIVGLRTGELLEFTRGDLAGSVLHAAAGPLKMQAGRDIVGSGDPLG